MTAAFTAAHNRWTNTAVWKERFDPKMVVEGEGFSDCEEGAWGWEFFKVQLTDEDLVLRKPRQSAFYQTHDVLDWWARGPAPQRWERNY